jgi:hypothetical protein
MIPTAAIFTWFSGLLSLGIIGGGVYLLREWYRDAWVYDALRDQPCSAHISAGMVRPHCS